MSGYGVAPFYTLSMMALNNCDKSRDKHVALTMLGVGGTLACYITVNVLVFNNWKYLEDMSKDLKDYFLVSGIILIILAILFIIDFFAFSRIEGDAGVFYSNKWQIVSVIWAVLYLFFICAFFGTALSKKIYNRQQYNPDDENETDKTIKKNFPSPGGMIVIFVFVIIFWLSMFFGISGQSITQSTTANVRFQSALGKQTDPSN